MALLNINNNLASETAKGIVEEATQTEVNAGTDTGATGARLFVTPSKYLAGILLKVLTGFAAGANTAVAATDTLAQALAKFQGQINARATISSPALTGTPTAPTAASGTNSTQIATTAFVADAVAKQPEAIVIACADETSSMTTGTKATFRMPFAMTLTSVRGSLTTAATGATLFAFDIQEGGVTIFSTKPTFDASATTTVGAATPNVISDTSLADNAIITVIVDAIGSTLPGVGLKVYLIGTRT